MRLNSAKLLLSSLLLLCTFYSYGVSGKKNNDVVANYLREERTKYDWLEEDINDWVVSDDYTDKLSGITHTYVLQQYQGIGIYNAISIFLIRDNRVIYFKSGILDRIAQRINTEIPSISPVGALHAALDYLGKTEKPSPDLIRQDSSLHKFFFDLPNLSESTVTVQLIYRQVRDKLVLAWDVSIEMKDEPHWWNIRIDASDGSFIDKNDFTRHCSFGDSEDMESVASDGEAFSLTQPAITPAVPQYNVFPYPLEAPSFGSRALLSDPSDPAASPYGWHDVDGIAGEDFTLTRGNNVFAYEDANNNNAPGYSPDGGSSLIFDFPFTSGAAPLTNRDASLTNLFYCNNRIHDFLYAYGFDELAGNFQQNNYGNGGLGNDYVKAEGFDGSGTNNANFNTPPDGFSGRMQMYLWSGNSAACSNLTIASATFNGPMTVGSASFSPAGSVTDTLILVNDGVGTTTDACSAINNNVSGKIVLIDRGSCTFISKAQTAAAAGAVGVIIANNTSGAPPTMTGSPAISIPCVSITQADGNTLKSLLQSGTVTATINTCVSNEIDGSFDNGIIAHEYGHGLSNRLTGGPSQSGCLSNGEQGGEGWSDWLALIMTYEPGDSGTDPRGVGTYAKGQPTSGPGIRRYPYSTDMNVNPQTYADLSLNPEVHAIGEIWCDVLWDMTWRLIDDFGYSSDPLNDTAGNNVAVRLVLEGMKLQPCGPGFLDARDAILNAEAILYNNIHRCQIWEAFARRGMGADAQQGSANIAGDETAGFSLPAFCLPPVQSPTAAFTSDLNTVSCGGSVQFTDQSVQAFEWNWNFGDLSSSTLQNPRHTFTAPGNYAVKLVVTNPLGADSILHNITVSPNFSVVLSSTPDSICPGDQVALSSTASGATNRSYLVESIPFAPLSGSGTSVTLSDDQVSGVKPIGFTFNFFGQDYTGFYISSNGLITFSPGMPASPVYGAIIPSFSDPDNFIALAWNDLNPQNAGSSITYFTTGIAPDRKLVVTYSTSHYGGTSYPFVVQAILYETTNFVEIHTTTISDASAFDPAATTTQGLENADGSRGVFVPGRNAAIFAASHDAYRFTPYIPYSYTWIPGNLDGPAQTVSPASTTIYTVYVSDGTACIAPYSTAPIKVRTNCVSLNLKLFLEGFYTGNGKMQPVLLNNGLSSDTALCDSISVRLYDPQHTAVPAAVSFSVLHTDGIAACEFPSGLENQEYYLAVRHRNSIETWSSTPVLLTNGNTYDFTLSQNKAFGSNMIQVFDLSGWAFYSGDISDSNTGLGNQDGVIESQDYSDMENAVSVILTGYQFEDLTGDGVVESSDYSLMDNNVSSIIFSIHP
jgi:PKD repeat protein